MDCLRGIHEVVARWAHAEPRRAAVRAGDSTLSYGELDAGANRLAAHLINIGVRPGDVVGVPGVREPATFMALLGILKAGGAYLALETDATQWRAVLRDAGVTVIVAPARDRLPEEIDTNYRVVRSWDAMATSGVPTDPERPAYVAYTSGSTGEPKGVRVPHRAVIRLVVDATYLPIRPDDVFLQFAPLAFDASTLEVWGALANGACLVLAPQGDLSLSRLTGIVRDEGVTVLWLTAGMFHQVVDFGLADLRGLRILLAGGDVLAVDRVNKAVAQLPDTLVINGYGPTENTTFTSCHAMREPVTASSVPIGREIDQTKVYLLDANQSPVDDGEPGELYAAGAGLALDYLGRPAATAARFLPDPSGGAGARMFRTGDLARRMPDGSLEFLGRVDSQVKIRGFRVETGAVELAIRRLAGVRDVAVVAPRTSTGDRKLMAFVVADRPAEVSTVAWRDQLAERLRAHEVPAVIRVVDALPLNPNGKVDRAGLEQRTGAERPDLSAPYREPETGAETTVVRLWTDLLEIEGIGVDDDFFELGGHSLVAVRILGELRLRYGIDITPLAFYVDPTPAGLARRIAGVPALETL